MERQKKKTAIGGNGNEKDWLYWNGKYGICHFKGTLQVFDREVLLLTDADRKRAEKISEETGVACAADNAACASMADYVVLAVKPQYYDAVLSDIKRCV